MTCHYIETYLLMQGTTVYANIYAVHHSNEYWEDPEVFRPERFFDENGNVHSTERVMTFGLGKYIHTVNSILH